RLLEDTTGRTPTTTGHPQPWAEARAVGDEPLGSVYDPFPLERNNVVTARDITQVLAVTSRHAFVRAPRVPAPRPRAGVAAAARAPPLVLTEPPVPVELASPPGTPPREVDTMSLPVPADPKLAHATSVPDWLRQQGMRVLWTSLLATRDGRRVVRSGASLDSIVSLLDAGGFNLLAGDAGPESTDSLHTRWDEREAVRRAWADAAKRLPPTAVAWSPVLDVG